MFLILIILILLSCFNSILCETLHVSEISRYLEIRDDMFTNNILKEDMIINIDYKYEFEFLPCNISSHQYPHLAAFITLSFCVGLFMYIYLEGETWEGVTGANDDEFTAPNFESND